MTTKRKASEILQNCLSKITPEEKIKTDFYLSRLAEWHTCHDDIVRAIEDEGIECNTETKYAIIDIVKDFYIKGILDAYNKLKLE